jgi:hydrolase family protein
MPDYPQLVYLSVPELTGAAGGDPWQVDDTIQAGAPGEISELAESFYTAGVSMTQTSDEFIAAKKRFETAWDRDDPAHPINDSVEVQRATQIMRLNKEELTRVGVDLQNIAASLAEAQRSGHVSISGLNGRLVQIDNTIATEIQKAQADGVQLDWSALKTAAIDEVKRRLGEVNGVRDAYGKQLSQSRVEMAAEGYDSDPIDGSVSDGTKSVQDQARADAEKYGADQRAADEALVNSPGPWTPEKQAAKGRLRDFATITNPNADPEQVRYAGERLGDYNMARFVGPLPQDPIFGRDARQRAQERLATQAMLEQGLGPMAPMDPNYATAMLDMGESEARQISMQRATDSLLRAGMSPEGARAVVGDLARGVPWNQLLEQNGQLIGTLGAGGEAIDKGLSGGRHYLPSELTSADAGILGDVSKKLGVAGIGIDFFDMGYDISQGNPAGKRIGEFVGSNGAAYLAAIGTAAAAGSVFGPGGTFVAVVIASVAASEGGKWVGGQIGSQFDN